MSGIRSVSCREVYSLVHPDGLAEMIAEFATIGDMVVCLGAGNITLWANQLPAALDRLSVQEDASGRGG